MGPGGPGGGAWVCSENGRGKKKIKNKRYGARTGSSVVYLGIFKVVLAVILGSSVAELFLENYPNSILGAMLVYTGVQLASSGGKKIQRQRDADYAFVTAGAVLWFNTGMGAACGLLVASLQSLYERMFGTGTLDDYHIDPTKTESVPLDELEHKAMVPDLRKET